MLGMKFKDSASTKAIFLDWSDYVQQPLPRLVDEDSILAPPGRFPTAWATRVAATTRRRPGLLSHASRSGRST
jgi:hypothetical protein